MGEANKKTASSRTTTRFDKVVILLMSAAFLIVVVGFILLIGTGRINLGIDPAAAFLVYIVAGLLVAFATFGILTSSGELSGSPFGVRIKLGGSLVAAVVVAAGGSLYEIYVRPSSFSTRVMFYETAVNNPITILGTFSIIVGAGIRKEQIQQDGTVLFQNLNQRRNFKYLLNSPSHEIHPDEDSEIELTPDSLVALRVTRKTPFESYDTAELRLNFESAETVPAMSNEYSVTIRANAWAESERPIPLRSTAMLRLTKAGLPYRTFTADVTGSSSSGAVIIVKPSEPETLFVNLLVPSDYEDMIHMGFEADLVFQYADPARANGGEFYLQGIAFDEKTFRRAP